MVAEYLRRNQGRLSRATGFLRQLKNASVISLNAGLASLQVDLSKIQAKAPQLAVDAATEEYLKSRLGQLSVDDCHTLLSDTSLVEGDIVRVHATGRVVGQEYLPYYASRIRILPTAGSYIELIEEWFEKGETIAQGTFPAAALVAAGNASQKVIKVLFRESDSAKNYFDGYDQETAYDYVILIGYVTSVRRYCSNVVNTEKREFSDKALVVCQMDADVTPV